MHRRFCVAHVLHSTMQLKAALVAEIKIQRKIEKPLERRIVLIGPGVFHS